MATPWFKFFGSEYLSSPKIFSLNGNERSCWVTLLCLASHTKDGKIRFLSEDQLLIQSGVSQKIEIYKKLQDFDMISVSNGNVTIKNWEERQLSESIFRVREFRKRQSNDNVTTEREEKKEKRRKKDKEIELPIWINKNKWDEWVTYLTEKKRKKPANSTLIIHLKKLEKDKVNHVAMIDNAIDAGWSSVFPIKKNERFEKRIPRRYEEPDDSKEVNERIIFLNDQKKKLLGNMTKI